jgi:protease PrsW
MPVPPTGSALKSRRFGTPRWALLTGAILIIAGSAIAMILILGFSIGPTGLIIGLVAAMLPVPVLVACFLWLDRYEPEPVHYLLFAFGWGAVVSTLVAYHVNSFFAGEYGLIELPGDLVAIIVAPVIEEFMKALGPLLILWLRRREISGITDGIVYCGLSGVGFAMVENVLYLGGHGYASGADEYGPATGAQLVFGLFIVRILFSGFAHPLFTSMTGIGIGIAARSGRPLVFWTAPLLGLVGAMLLHSSWNLMATLAGNVSPFFFLYGYVALMVPLFLTMVGVALWIRSKEGRLTARVLADYARAGWITPPEVAALATLTRRHAARAWATRVAGEPGHRAMKDLQFTAVRLALLRDSLNRGLFRDPNEHAQAVADERELLNRLQEDRAMFVGRDPQMPRAFWDGTSYLVDFPDGEARRLPAPAEAVVPLPFVLPPPPPAFARPGYGPTGYGPPPGYAGPR